MRQIRMNKTQRANRDLTLYSDIRIFFYLLDLLDGARIGHRFTDNKLAQIEKRYLTGHVA